MGQRDATIVVYIHAKRRGGTIAARQLVRAFSATRMHRSSNRPRGRRALAILGSAIAVAVCFFLVNQLLVWRALRRLGEGPLRLDYESAFSWIPGVVCVKGLIVKPLGSTWSATAESLRAEFAVTDLVRGSLGIHHLTAQVVKLNDPTRSLTAGGELQIAARGIRSEQGCLRIDGARLSLKSFQVQLGSDTRAVLDGDLRLTTIRGPITRGRLSLEAPDIRLRAHLSAPPGIRRVQLLVDGRLGVSEGRLDPRTRLTTTLQAPLEVQLQHWVLRVSGASALKITSRAGALMVTGHSDKLSLRSRASYRELLLRDAHLEPLPFASVVDAGTAPLAPRLRAAELELNSGTDLGRLRSPMRGVATVVRHERSGWRMASVSLELPRVRFESSAPTEPPNLAIVRLQDTNDAPGAPTQLQGSIEVHGPRLGALYPLLGIPPSVELMLAPFREQPFSASARLDSTAEGTSFSDIGVGTHTLDLRGFLRVTHGKKRGALLVVTPAVTLGLSLRNERRDVIVRPPPDWLERQRSAH